MIDHISHPGTRFFAEYYYQPMETGWNEEAVSIGTLNRVKIREIHGFMYYQMGSIETKQEFGQMCQVNAGYWWEKRYLSRLSEWDEMVKPAASRQLLELQRIQLDQLSTTGLIDHILQCLRVTKQMVKNHHAFTYTAFIPVGDFVRQVSEWTGRSPVQILAVLKRRCDSNLLMSYDAPAVRELVDKLSSDTAAHRLLSKVAYEPDKAGEILAGLMDRGESISRGLRYILDHFGYHLTRGYDISAETFLERPDILLKALSSILDLKRFDAEKETQQLRDLVPHGEKHQFDEMLIDAREMQRLRNERGMYSDLWAAGILRHAVLEAGRRLARKGTLPSPELALYASPSELADLLRGQHMVSSTELKRRADYSSIYSVANIPAVVGSPAASNSNLNALPPAMQRTMIGLTLAIRLAVEHPAKTEERQNVLVGTPASQGIVEGPVRVILSEDQFKEIKRGDILVVHQTTVAFSLVFPLIAGVVSQFGGILSHPAILAREYGIPCVVGCADAVHLLKTGMRVRLNGNNGEITVMMQKPGVTERLEALQCEYYGPMQGRNRDRVLNHVASVSKKISFVEKMRQDNKCLSALSSHFNAEISTGEAAKQILAQLNRVSDNVSIQDIESLVHRHHLEFHPCDACNLGCAGCTYFQDTPSRPGAVSFPYQSVSRICSVFQPKAITIVGGGEPSLYKSAGYRLGDLIYALGEGEFGCAPALGLISNGVLWPPGNEKWSQYVSWVRYSLDSATSDSYKKGKGKDYFDQVVENVFRTLTETSIPQVGIGYLYHPGNIVEAGDLISSLAQRVRKCCPDQLHRINIQFRPWRQPGGRPSIQERILSNEDIHKAAEILFKHTEQDAYVEQFTRQNTNIAVNLLCGGAREHVKPFSECYFGFAKTVVRADGSLYPCFRMGANRDPQFTYGSIVDDFPLSIALKELYVALISVQQVCVPEHDKCLFCVFNNALEAGLVGKAQPKSELAGDYFF